MPKQTLAVLSPLFTVHRFSPETKPDPIIFDQATYFIGKTTDELSVVISSDIKLNSVEQESDWYCLKVLGPLDFSLTGILADISGVLAIEKISIFAVSTFDTDYILVKQDALQNAVAALEKNDYKITQ